MGTQGCLVMVGSAPDQNPCLHLLQQWPASLREALLGGRLSNVLPRKAVDEDALNHPISFDHLSWSVYSRRIRVCITTSSRNGKGILEQTTELALPAY